MNGRCDHCNITITTTITLCCRCNALPVRQVKRTLPDGTITLGPEWERFDPEYEATDHVT